MSFTYPESEVSIGRNSPQTSQPSLAQALGVTGGIGQQSRTSLRQKEDAIQSSMKKYKETIEKVKIFFFGRVQHQKNLIV